MKTSLKEILVQAQEQKVVPHLALQKLEQRLFRASWQRGALWLALSAMSVAACAVIFLPTSPLHPLTPQEVLAQALQNSSIVPDGSLFIMTTNIVKDGEHFATQTISSDGTHARLQNETSEGTTDTWYEKVNDTTVDVYSVNDAGEVQHTTNELGASTSWPEGTLFPQSQETTSVTMCDDENTCKSIDLATEFLPEEGNEKQEMTLNFTVDDQAQITITGVVARFAANNVQSLTRQFFVDTENMRIERRTWDAMLEDGSRSTGEMTYTYDTIPLADLGHEFSLAWWKSVVGAHE